jgi:hypothetical protein
VSLNIAVLFRNFPPGIRGLVLASLLGWDSSRCETLTVLADPSESMPERLGYNLGHFMPQSNAADWFRYSGATAARIFISVSEIEPNDDLSPVGDGVTSESAFFNRRSLLRANASSKTTALSETYVRWSYFSANYSNTSSSGNRLQPGPTLTKLRDLNVAALANLTASPTRFPITGANDWGGRWELWQHYYAQAFLLSRDYQVQDFSMFNEPNGWTGMTEEDWLLRLRFCSDAIQCAVADMNTRYGRSQAVRVFAPNTANGSEKYNTLTGDAATSDTWGRDAILNRHLRLDGTLPPSWMNLHIYNYQKYTTRTHASGSLSGYLNDYDSLRTMIDDDMPGEPRLPIALTEFNVRTSAQYETTTQTQDSPADFTALGASCVALTERGAHSFYLFKFGQTASTSASGVAKNGTHYVQNASGSGNHYGGATQVAEVFRLFNKAAKRGLQRLPLTASPGASPGINSGLWSLASRDPVDGTCRVFLSNRDAVAIPLEVDFSALGVPEGNPVFIEEVSSQTSGGVVGVYSLEAGKLPLTTLPGESVWLITTPGEPMTISSKTAVADTVLGDGTTRETTGSGQTQLEVRADGTVNGRRVAVIRIPVPLATSLSKHSILLELEVAATQDGIPTKAHVYGVNENAWSEASLTWAGASALLKQNVEAGNLIAHNVVAGQGTTAQILGQWVASSTNPQKRWLDVTQFARSRADGIATFIVVQDHRWDVAQPSLTLGDTQASGLLISSRESASPPRLLTLSNDQAAFVQSQPQSLTVTAGQTASLNVVAGGTPPFTYQWRKNGVKITNATKAEFVLPSVQAGDAGSYQVAVTNPFETVVSAPAQLEVLEPGQAKVAREAFIRGGIHAASDMDEAGTGYLMVKFSSSLDGARKSYFQFDLPPGAADLNAPATFQLGFKDSRIQQVQLWGLNQTFPNFSTGMTWDDATANLTTNNSMITSGTPSATAIGPSVRINPGPSLTPYAFTLPRLGDFLFGNRVTLVLTGVDNSGNNDGGLRVAIGSCTLQYSALANHPPGISSVPDQSIHEDSSTGPLSFRVEDAETDPAFLVITATSSNLSLVPASGIVLHGSGATRSIDITPTRDTHGTTEITITVSDGVATASTSFILTVVPDAPWVQWNQQAFGNPPSDATISAPTADPDNDGVSNLMEYALATDPWVSGTSQLPSVTWSAGAGLQFRFRRHLGRTDIEWIVESTDAPDGPWMDAAISTGGSPFTAVMSGFTATEDAASPMREVVITDNNPLTDRKFLRLRVVINNP